MTRRGRSFARLGSIATAVLVVHGCDGGGSEADAGSGDASADAGTGVVASAPPALPILTPCPEGWVEGTIGEIAICEPWALAVPPECAALDQAARVGEAGCVRIGTASPPGDFADGLPTDGSVVFVDPEAASGGDGTAARPFDTIALGMTAARSGMIVALAKGEYDENVLLRAGVTLRGASVSDTIVRSSAPSTTAGVIDVMGGEARVENLQIGASARPALTTSGRLADATISDVVIRGVTDSAVKVTSGRVALSRVVVRDTNGLGLWVLGGATLEASYVDVRDNAEVGAVAEGAGSALLVRDSSIRGTRPRADGAFGRGLNVQGGAGATIERSAILSNHDVGVFGGLTGTSITLTDVVVQGTESQPSDGSWGRGVSVDQGATIALERVLVRDNRLEGVAVNEAASHGMLTDVVVAGTRGRARDDAGGRGLSIALGATMDVTRVLLVGNREVGVFVWQSPSMLRATDLVVRDTGADGSSGLFGRGLDLELGARGELTRAAFEAQRDVGVLVREGSSLIATDLVVRDTRSRESDGLFGRAIELNGGSTAEVVRAALERNREASVVAFGEGTSGAFTELVVATTLARDCHETGCPDGPASFGTGLAAVGMGRLDVTSFLVTDSFLCGAQVAFDGELDLRRGTIRRAQVGACIQVDGYDVGRLSNEVVYRDNGANLEATSLPVPSAGEGVAP